MKLALNPIQWMATDDGWLDPALAPALDELLEQVKRAGFDHVMAAVPPAMTASAYAERVELAGLQLAPGYFVCRLKDDPTDVSDILAEAGPNAGPDGGPTFEEQQYTAEDVARLCADPGRYENGADFVEAPK